MVVISLGVKNRFLNQRLYYFVYTRKLYYETEQEYADGVCLCCLFIYVISMFSHDETTLL